MKLRRRFLKRLISLSLFGLIPVEVWAKAECTTGKDVEGPFYRPKPPSRTKLSTAYHATGERLIVTGTVFASDCTRTLDNAEVDVWHASPKGDYDNSSKEYLFRGLVKTDAKGYYSFETLLPGIYASRPRHIHYKVRHRDHKELTTQLYFSKDKRLNTDSAVASNNGKDRAMPYERQEDGTYKMTFNIYLE